MCLYFWIYILTFYIYYISLKDKKNIKKGQKIFNIIGIVSIILIIMLPIKVTITENGSAIAEGLAVIYTYIMFALGFIVEILCVLSNYKNLKSKKYIPLYLLILMGTLVLLINMLNPSLNYIINPALIFIAMSQSSAKSIRHTAVSALPDSMISSARSNIHALRWTSGITKILIQSPFQPVNKYSTCYFTTFLKRMNPAIPTPATATRTTATIGSALLDSFGLSKAVF